MLTIKTGSVVLATLALTALTACETAPPRHASRSARVVQAPEPPAPPPSQVYFYPTQGQSEAQQDRDRYECYNWAVRQTGYDPSRRRPREADRVAVVPQPAPHAGAIAGAATGAIVGATVARNSGQGAIVGAVAGTLLGSAADASAQQQADQEAAAIQTHQNRRSNLTDEREAAGYRRAMSACLEGRGYSVK